MDNPQEAGPHTKVESMVPMSALTDKEFTDLVQSILVVIPHRADEGIHPGLANHFAIWGRIGLKFATLKDPSGGYIETIRGNMEKTFLELCDIDPKVKFLVMIDNDEAVSWDAPLQLAKHDLPVVSGVICAFNSERGIFSCFLSNDAKGVPRFASDRFTDVYPGKGLKKIHSAGTGLLCIRRDVFETLVDKGEFSFMVPDHYRKEGYRAGHMKQTEDFAFCDRVRDAGFDIHVDFAVRGLHFKQIAIGLPDSKVDDDLDANDWTVSSLDFRGIK